MPATDAARSILIVEDDEIVRDMIVSSFRDAGWTVLEAASGDEALEHLNGEVPVDVIFTDIRLKGAMNGWDVGEACRRMREDVPVIYTTGDAISPPRPVSGSKMLRKPYDPMEVLQLCFGLVGRYGEA
jgi:CheY-like chemotaxis protein